MSTGSLNSGGSKSCGCYNVDVARKNGAKKPYHSQKPKGYSSCSRAFMFLKRNAKVRNITVAITRDDFAGLSCKNCYYCDSPPRNYVMQKGATGGYTYNGLDRVDNKRGYYLDNVVPCCSRCNTAKNNMTQKDFLTLIYNIYHNICAK